MPGTILYSLLYPALKCCTWLIVRLLPVEAFNKLCLVLPSRLVVYGLRALGATIGENTVITSPITFHNFADKSREAFANLTLGKDCYVGRNCFFDLKDKIVIENQSTLAMGVTIVTHTDVNRSPLKQKSMPSSQAPVTIRSGAYVGASATILQGVELGEMSAIAAGAVVTASVPKKAVYGGVPAKQISQFP